MKDKQEGLENSCENQIGGLLKVIPIHGWGWYKNNESVEPPSPFILRLNRLWQHDGIRRGGIGEIEDSSHVYNGYMAIFDLRHYGCFNFTNKTGHYNIEITKSKIIEINGWPSPEHQEDRFGGYAEIICGG